jgi:uncharacterized membrane protein
VSKLTVAGINLTVGDVLLILFVVGLFFLFYGLAAKDKGKRKHHK